MEVLDTRPIIGVTMGDPAGIGPEIVIKALLNPEVQRISRPIVIGDYNVLKHTLKMLKVEGLEINRMERIDQTKFTKGVIDLLDLNNVEYSKLKVGKVSAPAGRAAVEYLEKAIDLAMAKKIDAISTAPINKEAIHKAGYKYQGHTEILVKRTKTKKYAMMFISDSLWVMLVTTHVPLKDISKELTRKKVLDTIKLAHETLKDIKKRKPRIGVAGLNPHAGEAGIFGEEDLKIIKPAVDKARRMGIDAKGPISPDAIFYLANVGMFDIVIAMYHDQGLIPLKLLAFNRSVNITAGLPIIRTSVDHGTGFDIAGKGWANPSSLIEAIKAATLLVEQKRSKK